MAKFEVPDGWGIQAFRFTLDPTEDQARSLARHFGARRKAYNWTVATLKADIEAWVDARFAGAKATSNCDATGRRKVKGNMDIEDH